MLENKTGIIFGVANKRSIAWATAVALHEAGARLAFTYQGDRLKENVESLTAEAMISRIRGSAVVAICSTTASVMVSGVSSRMRSSM